MYGQAQLAVLTDPPNERTTLYFENMIGDRTGAIHVGSEQVMDLRRDHIDLPFSVHVYENGYLGLAPDTHIHGIDIHLNGTLAYVENLTLHHDGELYLYSKGRTEGQPASEYDFINVHIKSDSHIHVLSHPVTEPEMVFRVNTLEIDGGGELRGAFLYIHAVNITIDAGGTLNADGLGYQVADGAPYEADGKTYRRGAHGVINPGLGTSGATGSSGAGHGGSGGRGRGLSD